MDLNQKSLKELQVLLNQERAKLGELRFKLKNKQLKNVKEIIMIKKNIARILTKINQIRNQDFKNA